MPLNVFFNVLSICYSLSVVFILSIIMGVGVCCVLWSCGFVLLLLLFLFVVVLLSLPISVSLFLIGPCVVVVSIVFTCVFFCVGVCGVYCCVWWVGVVVS